MSSKDIFEALSPVLVNYGLQPYYIEEFGKIHKIYSNNGVFALKSVSPTLGIDFIRHVQFLYQKGYNRIVPIYPTMDGRYAVLYQNTLYYLMPWLSNEEKEDHIEKNKQLFRELARLHMLSTKEVKISKEERKVHYETTLLLLEKDEEFINGFIERCESKVYMAPFELQFCTYYHDIYQAIGYSKRNLEAWYEKTKEEEKVRTVITHGKFSSEHFLYDDRGYGYFMNFENAKPGSPYHDLLPYLSRSLKGYPRMCEECVDWLVTYDNYYPLKEGERLLMLSYFAHPVSIMRVVQNYHKQQSGVNERKFSQKLQRQYWQLKNTEYICMRLEEIERQKKQQQEAQEKAQND